MKQVIYLLLNLALFSLIITGGCEPRDPCKYVPKPTHETHNLSEETKSKIPYREDGRDTLVYISDAGDTATLYGQGIDSFYTTESRNGNGDPDCPIWNTWKYETITLTFNGQNSTLNNLQIRYKATTDFRITSNNQGIGFTTIPRLNSTSFLDTTVIINGSSYQCLKLFPIRPDTTTVAFFNYDYGLIQFKLNSYLWSRKL